MIGKLGLAAAAIGMVVVATREGPTDKAYPVPIAEARAMLLDAEVPTGVFGSGAGRMRTVTLPVEASDVRWTVTYRRKPLFRYTARLVAVDPVTTSVRLELAAADPKLAAKMEGNPTIVELYRATMEEKVSSTLERRPFDMTAAYPALGKAIAANIGSIAADADRAGKAMQEQDRRNIERAYADEDAR